MRVPARGNVFDQKALEFIHQCAGLTFPVGNLLPERAVRFRDREIEFEGQMAVAIHAGDQRQPLAGSRQISRLDGPAQLAANFEQAAFDQTGINILHHKYQRGRLFGDAAFHAGTRQRSSRRLAGAIHDGAGAYGQRLVPSQGADLDQAGAFGLRLGDRGMQHRSDISRLADHRVGHAGERQYGKRQHPKAVFQPQRTATGGALQPQGEFLRKPAGDRQGFRVCRVPQIQSTDGAHLGNCGQPAPEAITLQQHHLRTGPSGRGGRRHARRAAADNQHVAGNGGGTL